MHLHPYGSELIINNFQYIGTYHHCLPPENLKSNLSQTSLKKIDLAVMRKQGRKIKIDTSHRLLDVSCDIAPQIEQWEVI